MGGAAQDQAALGEHLASHGYVVATTPSPLRLGLPMESESDVAPMARAQAADLDQAREALVGWPVADLGRIAIAGYSFGGRAALLVAARHPEIRALLSLDGGIASADAKDWLTPADLDRAALRVPVLHLAHDPRVADEPRTDWILLDSLTGTSRASARWRACAIWTSSRSGRPPPASPRSGRPRPRPWRSAPRP